MSLLELRSVWRTFDQPDEPVDALRDVDLEIEEGALVRVFGESGSGKSTLLGLLGALDLPSRGSVSFFGQDLSTTTGTRLAALRLRNMGFVFQDFLLIRHLNVLDNVSLPLYFAGADSKSDVPRRLLERVGLGHRLHHRAHALSRGEMQRVALARALVNCPRVLFADEPTANLDRRNSSIVMDVIHELHDDGLTVVVASHNPDLVRSPDQIVELDDGRIVRNEA